MEAGLTHRSAVCFYLFTVLPGPIEYWYVTSDPSLGNWRLPDVKQILGNAKILNAGTHNDLLTETHMTNYQYTLVQSYHTDMYRS